MRILVVDDELLVRIGIKSCINWQEHGMQIVGEASDGIEALGLMESLKPDVMLLDIKMPKMNGIALLRQMKEKNLQCKVIILSGFDDVLHVKEAMRYGAVDYFHKPCMNSKDMLDTLLDIKSQIEKENISARDISSQAISIERNKSILKDVFLKELIQGKIPDSEAFNVRNKEIGSKLENKNFSCIVFCVKNCEEINKRYANSKNTLETSTMNVLGGLLAKESCVELISFNKNLYAVITSCEKAISEKKVIEGVNSIVELITGAMKQLLNVEVVIGVSDIHKTSGEVKNAFDEAMKALKHKFFIRDGDIIHYRDIKRVDSEEALVYVDSLIGKMKDHIAKHDFISFERTSEEFVCFLEEQPCLTEEDVKKLYNGFLFIIRDSKEGLDEMERINSCKYLRQLYDMWTSIIHEKLEGVSKAVQFKNCSYLIKRIASFIEENYSQEITLNLLSKQFNVSPNYISRLFKEETGEALFNYINAVRVEKAKKLLLDADLKIYEVSDKVGFKSPVHFNIVFNKFTGTTPKQYRAGS